MLNHTKLFHIPDSGIGFDFCISLKILKVWKVTNGYALENSAVSHTTIITIFGQETRSTLP